MMTIHHVQKESERRVRNSECDMIGRYWKTVTITDNPQLLLFITISVTHIQKLTELYTLNDPNPIQIRYFFIVAQPQNPTRHRTFILSIGFGFGPFPRLIRIVKKSTHTRFHFSAILRKHFSVNFSPRLSGHRAGKL